MNSGKQKYMNYIPELSGAWVCYIFQYPIVSSLHICGKTANIACLVHLERGIPVRQATKIHNFSQQILKIQRLISYCSILLFVIQRERKYIFLAVQFFVSSLNTVSQSLMEMLTCAICQWWHVGIPSFLPFSISFSLFQSLPLILEHQCRLWLP